MTLHKISEITQPLPFKEFDFMQKYREGFIIVCSDPYTKTPSPGNDALNKVENACRSRRGRKPVFSPEEEVALMFLKMDVGRGDEKLIEMLTVNINMQIFFGVLVDPSQPIKNGRIVRGKGNNRVEFGTNVDNIQIDCISFIEHPSFEAFKEGNA